LDALFALGTLFAWFALRTYEGVGRPVLPNGWGDGVIVGDTDEVITIVLDNFAH
jgi:hypothetical protein